MKRLFLEACKKAPGDEIAALPMSIYDKKYDFTIDATATGGGGYRLATADGGADDKVARRVDGVTRGLIKLAEMEPGEEPGEGPLRLRLGPRRAGGPPARPGAQRPRRHARGRGCGGAGASSLRPARNSRPEGRERKR